MTARLRCARFYRSRSGRLPRTVSGRANRWRGGLDFGPKVFFGFGNYAHLFTDPRYIRAFWNTVYFTLLSIFVLGSLALPLAMALQSVLVRPNLRSFYRMVFFLPFVTSSVIVAVLWAVVLESKSSLLNQLLSALGPLSGWQHDWLRDQYLALDIGGSKAVTNVPILGPIVQASTVVWSALFLINIWNFIVFLIFQNQLISGITSNAVKGA